MLVPGKSLHPQTFEERDIEGLAPEKRSRSAKG
jgi:hypothetical protein